jgi:hypothetical protein
MHVGRPDARAASTRNSRAGCGQEGSTACTSAGEESFTLGGVVVRFHADVARLELDGQGEVLPVGVLQRNVDCRQQAVRRRRGEAVVLLVQQACCIEEPQAVASRSPKLWPLASRQTWHAGPAENPPAPHLPE